MANTDAPFGFRPNSHQAGGTPARVGGYNIAFDYATAIFSGQLVRSSGSAREIISVPDEADDFLLGIFAGCQYVNDANDIIWSQFWPGVALADSNTIVECWVYDDPQLEYIAQISTLLEADIGLLYAIDQTATPGNTRTGRSGAFIDHAVTSTPKVRITGLAENIGGIFPSEYGAFAKVRCVPLQHERNNYVTAI